MLKTVRVPKNTGKYVKPLIPMKFTRKVKFCKDIPIKNCKLDEFHSGEKYLQVILGRHNITVNCFSNCKNYFIVFAKKWSYFLNDVVIYNIFHNDFFYKQYSSLPLDPIFPMRVVLSNNDSIPTHKMKQIGDFIKEYGYDFKKGKTISDIMIKRIKTKYPNLTTKITKSPVLTRELCLLNDMDVYLYKVSNLISKEYYPYILISKYPLSFIKNKFKKSPYIFEYL